MAKNFIGREDNWGDDEIVVRGTVPSIEDAVYGLTGVRMPLMDLSRGPGSLANNAAVLAEEAERRLSQMKPAMPEAIPALTAPPQGSADRIRQLLNQYVARQRPAPTGVRSPYPVME